MKNPLIRGLKNYSGLTLVSSNDKWHLELYVPISDKGYLKAIKNETKDAKDEDSNLLVFQMDEAGHIKGYVDTSGVEGYQFPLTKTEESIIKEAFASISIHKFSVVLSAEDMIGAYKALGHMDWEASIVTRLPDEKLPETTAKQAALYYTIKEQRPFEKYAAGVETELHNKMLENAVDGRPTTVIYNAITGTELPHIKGERSYGAGLGRKEYGEKGIE